MAHRPGSFIWYELMTTAPADAARFYGAVVGWKISDHADPQAGGGQDYRMIGRDDGGNAGGVLKLQPSMLEQGARPAWLGYLHVDDVDAATKAIVADGGTLVMPKMSLPQGDIAMVHDPMGAPFYVMRPVPPADKPDAKSDVFDPKATQRIRWNELASGDLERAKSFYARHFNFEFTHAMPMGAMGDYCFFEHDGVALGAVMQKPAESPIGIWLFYFGVSSIISARRAIDEGGGKILMDTHQVPGGDWVIVAMDPQGAAFGVVGPKGE